MNLTNKKVNGYNMNSQMCGCNHIFQLSSMYFYFLLKKIGESCENAWQERVNKKPAQETCHVVPQLHSC